MKTKLKYEWVCTDADTKQYGRKLADNVFEFKQDGADTEIIDLKEYETKEQESIINSYGYTLLSGENKVDSLKNINDLYGKDAKFIIAECIFETNFF